MPEVVDPINLSEEKFAELSKGRQGLCDLCGRSRLLICVAAPLRVILICRQCSNRGSMIAGTFQEPPVIRELPWLWPDVEVNGRK